MEKHPDWETRVAELLATGVYGEEAVPKEIGKLLTEILQQSPEAQIAYALDLLTFVNKCLPLVGTEEGVLLASELGSIFGSGLPVIGLILTGLLKTHSEDGWQDDLGDLDPLKEFLSVVNPEIGVYLSVLQGRHYKPE